MRGHRVGETGLEEIVGKIDQDAIRTFSRGAVEQVFWDQDKVPRTCTKEAVFNKIFALARDGIVDLIGFVMVHKGHRALGNGTLDVKILGGEIYGLRQD